MDGAACARLEDESSYCDDLDGSTWDGEELLCMPVDLKSYLSMIAITRMILYRYSTIAVVLLVSTIFSAIVIRPVLALSSGVSRENMYDGKSVLLTGATSGLGRSLAIQLSSQCNVSKLVLSGRNAEALCKTKELCLESIKSETSSTVPEFVLLTCDLADRNDVQKLCKEISDNHSDIDILINNGGLSSRSKFVDTKIEVDELLLQVNFLSGAALTKAVVPGILSRKSNGAIIWISSVQGLLGIPNRTSYAASKFAVQGYCESLRAELATSGISVHIVSPGYIRTNLSKSAVVGSGEKYNKDDATTQNGAVSDDFF